jgi:beta-fructofuranosidase
MTATTSVVRPRVHLTPPAGWLNDPHGLTWHDGRYHLFFQHVPDSLAWRLGCHWGHATSSDLLHWEVEPIALSPGAGDDGCWSGCLAVGDDGEPRLLYTAVRADDVAHGLVRVARPADSDWAAWTKGEVVARTPRPDTAVFRDPMVFRDGERWVMLVGYGAEDGTAGAEVFVSPDLEQWQHAGLLATRPTSAPGLWTGTAWECPQLVRTGRGPGTDALLVSVWEEHTTHFVAGAPGTYADSLFAPGTWQRLTHGAGAGHYAASAFSDADGRSCLIFWIRGIAEAGGWTGAVSLPYLVDVDGDRIRLALHPNVAAARVPMDAAEDSRDGALDVEWSPIGAGRLDLVDADGRARASLVLAGGRLVVTVADGGQEPVVVDHAAGLIRVVADAQVLEVVADGGLVGLPLTPTPGGLTPGTDVPGSLACWRLR